MSALTTQRKWMIGAGVCCALLLGVALPRHAGGSVQSYGSVDPGETVPPGLAASDGSADSPAPSPSSADVVVYVCGAVRNPAVYRFSSGTRVTDAIAKAGGATADADLEQLNLAQPLADAMKIEVPRKGQLLAVSSDENASSPLVGRHRRGAGSRSGHSGSRKLGDGQTLDVNTASLEELTRLPGVGPGLAARIVEFRRQNGPFETVDDLQNVSGIGPSKFEKLVRFVRL